MSRGDRREDIFLDDVDRQDFLKTLAEACRKTGWYLAAQLHRPQWIRVDRLLGEHGLVEDTASARQEFERRMEAKRMEEVDEESLKTLRRGWCLGGNQFRKQMLEEMEGKLGEHHSGELRRESAEARAERIVAEELTRLGWTESDLAIRRKSDPAKLGIGVRLRQETTLSIKGIAARLHLGTSKSANARLHQWMDRTKRSNAPIEATPNQSKTNHAMG